MQVVNCDERTHQLVLEDVKRLELPADKLMLTTDRNLFGAWLGRRIPTAYGGAYCYLRTRRRHAILINLARIDLSKPRSLEIVVAEELIHMRDHLDGDHRRHAHHGYDRIAQRVSALTGATLVEIRSALIPVRHRSFRYVYQCPSCLRTVRRRKTGVWSCGQCSNGFDRRYVLNLVRRLNATGDVESASPG